MNENRTRREEAAQDIFFGQSVINWARWFVIAAAAVMVLDSNTTGQMVVGVLPILGLIVANFYLHGRRLAERPANPVMIVLASLMDVAFITWLVYAAFLHGRMVGWLKGSRAGAMAIVGFQSVMFTYLGVSFLLPGLHSYLN